jgi:hypothetical protein
MHYWMLFRLVKFLPRIKVKDHVKILIGVLGGLIAHVIEVWVFGVAYYVMNDRADFGYLAGNFDGSLLDCGYFSFATFTTAGYGDIFPEGGLRYTAGPRSCSLKCSATGRNGSSICLARSKTF